MYFHLKIAVGAFAVCALLVFSATTYSESAPVEITDRPAQLDHRGADILEALDLSFTQKTEIQRMLLAATQTMEVVNAQLVEFESLDSQARSEDIQRMQSALYNQRIQLAELLTVEILALLSPQQRARLNLRPKVLSVEGSQKTELPRETEL